MGASGSVLEESDTPSSSGQISNRNNTVLHGDYQKPVNKFQQQQQLLKSKPDSNIKYPTFDVSLGFWPGNHVVLPEKFKIKISYESLDFVKYDNESHPLLQFPFQNIICWGSSLSNFQFKIFDLERSQEEKKDSGILISLKTTQGKLIEDATMATVQKLMIDINQRAISKNEFPTLLSNLFDEQGVLKENWLSVLQQFTATGRLFLAKQGMEVLMRVGSQAPFEKFDLACFIYDRMINKNSVQLLINTFDDPQERDNLIHRLKLDKNKSIVADCVILPEKQHQLPKQQPQQPQNPV
jgi:hypothetical protein